MHTIQIISMAIITSLVLFVSTFIISSYKLKFLTKKDYVFIGTFYSFSLLISFYFEYVYIFLIAFMFTLVLKNKYDKISSCLFPLISVLLFFLTDQLFILVIKAFDMNTNQVRYNSNIYTILSVGLFVAIILFSYLIKVLFKKTFIVPKNEIENPKGFYVIIAIVYSILIGINIFFINSDLLIPILGLIVIFVIIFSFYSKSLSRIINDKLKSEMLKELHSYSKELEVYCTNFRKLNHYYDNILYTLDTYIENDNMEELRKYYKETIFPSFDKNKIKFNNLNDLSKIEIVELKSLLSAKCMIAQNQHIKINIEINDFIKNINLNSFDLCKIMGILFDNAVEASLTHESPEINIYLSNLDNRVEIKIANTFFDDDFDVSKIMEINYSTKGKNRGLGLNMALDIIQENKNIEYNIYAKNNIFTVDIYKG